LVFHALGVSVLFLLLNNESKISKEQPNNWIQVEMAADKEKDPRVVKHNKRIVQTEKGQKTEIAQPDANLGAETQKVDRQTISRNSAGRLESLKTPSHAMKVPAKSLSHLGLKLFPAVSVVLEESHWATPGMRPEDYEAGILESDRTALNTKEFKYYGYFQRIRERLDRAWVPVLREKLLAYFRSGRHLASDRDHVTKLLVVLNGKGEIIRVNILGESGTQELDSAAIAAFNKAGPFPNPPHGIIDREKEVKIPWDFVLKS
jgi:TonB family protein